MTASTQRSNAILPSGINEAIIDQLRACHTQKEIVEFEIWFNSKVDGLPLYSVICELLRSRSISRSTASKWFEALLKDRDEKLKSKGYLISNIKS